MLPKGDRSSVQPPKYLLSTNSEDIQKAIDEHFVLIFNRDKASFYLDCLSGIAQTELGMISAVDAVDVGLIPPTLAYLRYVSSCYKEAEKKVTRMLNDYIERTISKQIKISKDLGSNMPWYNQRKELTLSDNTSDVGEEFESNFENTERVGNSKKSNNIVDHEISLNTV